MHFKRLFSRREEGAPNESTSKPHSQPRPHHRFINTSISSSGCGCTSSLRNTTAQPEGKITAWKQGATVNVMIDPTFSPTQQQAIKDQFTKWKNAGGANVTFNFVEPSQAGGGATTGGPPIVSVMRQIPDKKGATAQGETEGFSYNGNRGDTFIDINPGVTDPTAFIHVVSHEVGHTFGLGECPTCSAGSSAMTLPQQPT